MAKLYTVGTEAITREILNESKRAASAIPKMLNAGADELIKEEKRAIKNMFTSKSSRSTGDLEKSIGKGKIYERDGKKEIDVYPQGKNRRGQRTAEYGSILQYGRKNMTAKKWYSQARQKGDTKVNEAMMKEWENAD